jgi:hypothetical protein
MYNFSNENNFIFLFADPGVDEADYIGMINVF